MLRHEVSVFAGAEVAAAPGSSGFAAGLVDISSALPPSSEQRYEHAARLHEHQIVEQLEPAHRPGHHGKDVGAAVRSSSSPSKCERSTCTSRAAGYKWFMDAITLLKEDHKKVEKLFKRFEKAGDKAYTTKRAIVDSIIEELSVHAVIEEELFYPVTRATVPETEDIALESLEEHDIVKWVLNDLDSMSPENERFDAKVTVLIENVRHHVEEEEGEYFPKVRDELGRKALNELGDALMAAKETAPTHPHPTSPDVPPGNVVGVASGIADRVSDTVSGVAQGSVSAAGDVIAMVLRGKKPSARPTGNKTARKTADKVRGGIDHAADAVIEKTQEAKRKGEATVKRTSRKTTRAASAAKLGAKDTARTASRGAVKTAKATKSGAKGTVTSARKGDGDTKSTAKRAMTTTARTASEAAKSTKTRAKRAATQAKRAATTTGHAPSKATKSKRTTPKVTSAAARGTGRKTSAGRNAA